MQTTNDLEAQALARCYALLLRKAAERRARLASETAVSANVKEKEIQNQDMQNDSHADD